jgi:hypothetical protein
VSKIVVSIPAHCNDDDDKDYFLQRSAPLFFLALTVEQIEQANSVLHRICILQLVDVLRSLSAILCSTSPATYWATDFGLPKQEPIPCQNPCQAK